MVFYNFLTFEFKIKIAIIRNHKPSHLHEARETANIEIYHEYCSLDEMGNTNCRQCFVDYQNACSNHNDAIDLDCSRCDGE